MLKQNQLCVFLSRAALCGARNADIDGFETDGKCFVTAANIVSKHWRFAAKLFVNHGRFMMCKAQWICWICLTGLTATAAVTALRSCHCLMNALLGTIATFVCSTHIVLLHISASTNKSCIDDRLQCSVIHYTLHIFQSNGTLPTSCQPRQQQCVP